MAAIVLYVLEVGWIEFSIVTNCEEWVCVALVLRYYGISLLELVLCSMGPAWVVKYCEVVQ